MSPKVLLIGGSSHAGKSTLARALGERLGWQTISTDSLARHPGRPWATPARAVPEHVAAHYLSLGRDELVASVRQHDREIRWPQIKELVAKHASGPIAEPLIIEGSAVWPADVALLEEGAWRAIWLAASDELLCARIHAESRYEAADMRGRQLIDKFCERTCAFNALMRQEINRFGFTLADIDSANSPGALLGICLSILGRGKLPS